MIRLLFKAGFRIPVVLTAISGLLLPVVAEAQRAAPARKLFAAKRLPTVQKPASFGFYSKGCLAGGVALPDYGPTWQAMRPSRNRRWGHPGLVQTIERLSIDAKKLGWNGLLVGDMSQPRGGPVKGHASHQVGLDVDIWLRQMPNRRFSRREREKTSAISMLKKGSVYVDNRIWTRAHEGLLKTAASYRQVERVLVHPGIKKKLCDTVKGDRRWLRKVRPYWGHQAHFHLRIKCQPGSGNCKKQAAPPRNIGCGKSLDWWFKVALAPKKKITGKKIVTKKKKKKVRRYKTMADLPRICRTVLNGPTPKSLASVIYNSGSSKSAAVGKARPATASAIKASTSESPAARAAKSITDKATDISNIPVPIPRPSR